MLFPMQYFSKCCVLYTSPTGAAFGDKKSTNIDLTIDPK